MHFREWKVWKFCILIKISLQFIPIGPANNNPALDNGLVPNRWQTIIWTNADPIPWRIYAAHVGDKLMAFEGNMMNSVVNIICWTSGAPFTNMDK